MRVTDFAWGGREFLVRCGSRILRCLVGWKWRKAWDICRLVRCGVLLGAL